MLGDESGAGQAVQSAMLAKLFGVVLLALVLLAPLVVARPLGDLARDAIAHAGGQVGAGDVSAAPAPSRGTSPAEASPTGPSAGEAVAEPALRPPGPGDTTPQEFSLLGEAVGAGGAEKATAVSRSTIRAATPLGSTTARGPAPADSPVDVPAPRVGQPDSSDVVAVTGGTALAEGEPVVVWGGSSMAAGSPLALDLSGVRLLGASMFGPPLDLAEIGAVAPDEVPAAAAVAVGGIGGPGEDMSYLPDEDGGQDDGPSLDGLLDGVLADPAPLSLDELVEGAGSSRAGSSHAARGRDLLSERLDEVLGRDRRDPTLREVLAGSRSGPGRIDPDGELLAQLQDWADVLPEPVEPVLLPPPTAREPASPPDLPNSRDEPVGPTGSPVAAGAEAPRPASTDVVAGEAPAEAAGGGSRTAGRQPSAGIERSASGTEGAVGDDDGRSTHPGPPVVEAPAPPSATGPSKRGTIGSVTVPPDGEATGPQAGGGGDAARQLLTTGLLTVNQGVVDFVNNRQVYPGQALARTFGGVPRNLANAALLTAAGGTFDNPVADIGFNATVGAVTTPLVNEGVRLVETRLPATSIGTYSIPRGDALTVGGSVGLTVAGLAAMEQVWPRPADGFETDLGWAGYYVPRAGLIGTNAALSSAFIVNQQGLDHPLRRGAKVGLISGGNYLLSNAVLDSPSDGVLRAGVEQLQRPVPSAFFEGAGIDVDPPRPDEPGDGPAPLDPVVVETEARQSAREAGTITRGVADGVALPFIAAGRVVLPVAGEAIVDDGRMWADLWDGYVNTVYDAGSVANDLAAGYCDGQPCITDGLTYLVNEVNRTPGDMQDSVENSWSRLRRSTTEAVTGIPSAFRGALGILGDSARYALTPANQRDPADSAVQQLRDNPIRFDLSGDGDGWPSLAETLSEQQREVFADPPDFSERPVFRPGGHPRCQTATAAMCVRPDGQLQVGRYPECGGGATRSCVDAPLGGWDGVSSGSLRKGPASPYPACASGAAIYCVQDDGHLRVGQYPVCSGNRTSSCYDPASPMDGTSAPAFVPPPPPLPTYQEYVRGLGPEAYVEEVDRLLNAPLMAPDGEGTLYHTPTPAPRTGEEWAQQWRDVTAPLVEPAPPPPSVEDPRGDGPLRRGWRCVSSFFRDCGG